MICGACKNKEATFEYREIINEELARCWKLKANEIRRFNLRESSFCSKCDSSLRSRVLAKAIMLNFPESKSKFFVDWVEWAAKNKLAVAEINYCGQLHQFLAKIPRIKTSQYQENTLKARITNLLKGIRREDITNLSYQDNSFDLVIHSEVLEHVSDVNRSLSECRRVLKPGGQCIFTIPLIISRKTRRRAKLNSKSKKIKHYVRPSYHGSGEKDNLVFWEFGGDFVKKNRLKIILAEPEAYMWVLKLEK